MEQLSKKEEHIIDLDQKLKPEYEKLKKMTDKEVLQILLRNKLLINSSISKSNTYIDMNQYEYDDNKFCLNGFAECLRLSYQYHIPLILSPDILWTAIMQGFANHIHKNSEKFRKKFVNFQGQKNLTMVSEETNLFKIDWQQVINGFSDQIKENIGDDLYQNLIPKFTSKTRIDTICQEITLMNTLKYYFTYGLVIGCGIPKIKFLGTKEDWENLIELTKSLKEFDLDWWIDYLIPVLEKIFKTFMGEVDLDFWNDVYQYRMGGPSSGPTTADGWIINFFPYLGNNFDNMKMATKFRDIKVNNFDNMEMATKFRYISQKNNQKTKIVQSLIPSGKSKANVNVYDVIDQTQYQIEFISGFLSIEMDEEGFIKPSCGHIIVK